MKPAYPKILTMIALTYFALRYDSTLCAIGAILLFLSVNDEDYR